MLRAGVPDSRNQEMAITLSRPPPSDTAPESFETIPPEIRNRIYELVLATPNAGIEVDLLTAQPPSKALLLTCRQIYDEVKYMEVSFYQYLLPGRCLKSAADRLVCRSKVPCRLSQIFVRDDLPPRR